MNTVKSYSVQALKWTAMAGSFSVFLFGSLVGISWLLFQFVVYLGTQLP
jgi:hypothetical protein